MHNNERLLINPQSSAFLSATSAAANGGAAADFDSVCASPETSRPRWSLSSSGTSPRGADPPKPYARKLGEPFAGKLLLAPGRAAIGEPRGVPVPGSGELRVTGELRLTGEPAAEPPRRVADSLLGAAPSCHLAGEEAGDIGVATERADTDGEGGTLAVPRSDWSERTDELREARAIGLSNSRCRISVTTADVARSLDAARWSAASARASASLVR